jgi:hypothetical protein
MSDRRMWKYSALALGLAGACLVTACDKAETTNAKPDGATKTGKTAKAESTASKTAPGKGVTKAVKDGADDAPAPAEPPIAVEPGKEASPFIGKKSAAPSTAEWDAQTKEVTVHGSSARMCETKMVREWLRVSCRGEPAGYGQAQSVTVLSGGGRGDDFVFSSAGVASLIVRFVPGVDLKAKFGWAQKSSTIHVYWPRGAPETAYKGKFSDG